MERNVTMAEISDGKLYSRDDMVKAGCDDCRGCSACCHGMGNSIVLDPYDVYRLTHLARGHAGTSAGGEKGGVERRGRTDSAESGAPERGG